MSRYIARRVLQAALLVLAVATLIAVVVRLIPGDPVSLLIGEEQAGGERGDILRAELGLDRPIVVQYFTWLGRLARGDLSNSLFSKRPIAPDLATRLPRTIELTLAATIIGALIGVPAGVFAAVHRNKLPDLVVSIVALLGLSSPVFVLGTLLVLVFGLWLHWVPATGFVELTQDPFGHLIRLCLPAITLGLGLAGVIARMSRSSMLEVLGEDYLRTARAVGLRERVVLARHALPNALIPVVGLVGVQMGTLLGGSVIIEYIFNWPGVSSFLLQGIAQRDYPVVQAVVLVVSALFVVLNLLTDLSYGFLDPRIRYE